MDELTTSPSVVESKQLTTNAFAHILGCVLFVGSLEATSYLQVLYLFSFPTAVQLDKMQMGLIFGPVKQLLSCDDIPGVLCVLYY